MPQYNLKWQNAFHIEIQFESISKTFDSSV